ncbi:MAG: hypothetical protein HKL90_04080 [Elusimicrobia bacterium]|nr:hypothetical protein [Elusimicrobiota bacterium]
MTRARRKDLVVLSRHLEIQVEFLEQCVRHGALDLDELPPDPVSASPAHWARLRRLARLCRDLELDVFAGAIIVDLLEQRDALRRELDGRGPSGR